MNVDHVFWWAGCLVSFGCAFFAIWFVWSVAFDQVFRSMKAQKEFIKYLLWKRKHQDKTRAGFDSWLKTVCFKKPTIQAYDLAKLAWEAALKVKS